MKTLRINKSKLTVLSFGQHLQILKHLTYPIKQCGYLSLIFLSLNSVTYEKYKSINSPKRYSKYYPRKYTKAEQEEFICTAYKPDDEMKLGDRLLSKLCDKLYSPNRMSLNGFITPLERLVVKKAINEINELFKNVKNENLIHITQENLEIYDKYNKKGKGWDKYSFYHSKPFNEKQNNLHAVFSFIASTYEPRNDWINGLCKSDYTNKNITIYVYKYVNYYDMLGFFVIRTRLGRIPVFRHEFMHMLGFAHNLYRNDSSVSTYAFFDHIGETQWHNTDMILIEMMYNKDVLENDFKRDITEAIKEIRRPDNRPRKIRVKFSINCDSK